MQIWIAGNTILPERERRVLKTKDERLQSYHFITEGQLNHKAFIMTKEIIKKAAIKLFLDSGAFSAFTQGVEIDIQEYIDFIKEHEEYLEVYANLDVIGDPITTWENQQIMEDAGLNPLPVFHTTLTDIKWLVHYLHKGYSYIALGGMAGGSISVQQIQPMLDNIFVNYICDSKGFPKVKVHGFGMTSHRLLWRYPWWSVDSTSWVITGRLGSILVPKFRKGKWDHRVDPWKVGVSGRSPAKKEAGKHFSTYSQMEQEVIQHYLDDKGYIIGQSKFRIEDKDYKPKKNERWHGKARDGKREVELIEELGLCNDYKLRDELNIIYYLDLEKTFPPWPYPLEIGNRKKGLF